MQEGLKRSVRQGRIEWSASFAAAWLQTICVINSFIDKGSEQFHFFKLFSSLSVLFFMKRSSGLFYKYSFFFNVWETILKIMKFF